jgi:integrase
MGGTRRTSDLHDVVLVLLGTGMRIGEALALRWTDIDLAAEIPYVRVHVALDEPTVFAASTVPQG